MPAKILLVEDDNNLREIYEARLMAEGYTIVTAKDGEEALVVAKAEKPSLVISDVMMPRISGFEMLDILRNTEDLRDTKVIMLTALGQADDKTRANSLGADRYLVKSQVTLEDIVKAAHDLTDGGGAPAAPTPTPPAASTPSSPMPPVPPTSPGVGMPAAMPATPPPAPVAAPVTPPMPTAPSMPPVPPAPAPNDAPADKPTDTSHGSVPIANKKIIQPLNSEPKQDIHALLAQEEAKGSSVPPAPAAPPAPAPGAAPALHPDMLNTPVPPTPQAGNVFGPTAAPAGAPQPPATSSDPGNIAL